MSDIVSRLTAMMTEAAAVEEMAATDDKSPNLALTQAKLRAKFMELDLEHCREILNRRLDFYRSVIVAPIVNAGTAQAANSSYTLPVLLQFPFSLLDTAQLVSEVMERMRQFGVEPSFTLQNFRRLVQPQPKPKRRSTD